MKTKVKIFNDINNTSFADNKNPKEKNHYISISK